MSAREGSALHSVFAKTTKSKTHTPVVLSLQQVTQQRTCAPVRTGDSSTYNLHTKERAVFPVLRLHVQFDFVQRAVWLRCVWVG